MTAAVGNRESERDGEAGESSYVFVRAGRLRRRPAGRCSEPEFSVEPSTNNPSPK